MATNFLPNWVHNAKPFQSDVAVLATGWCGHFKFMKYTLNSYRATGKYVLLAFDTHMKFDNVQSIERHFPPVDLLAIPNAIVLKHATWDADKRNGWLWNILYAAPILLSFPNLKHILTINSDCAFDKPEGVDALVGLLGDGDYMSQSVEYMNEAENKPNTMHTCSMLFKREAFAAVTEYFRAAMAKAGPESYSPELLLLEAHEKLGLKLAPTPLSPRFPEFITDFAGQVDHYQSYNEDSTWKEYIGFRNLCAENDTAGIERRDPLPAKYFDMRDGGALFPGYERETLYQYYMTGDWRHVWRWWDADEDSWYDRRYYPPEHYAPAPILKAVGQQQGRA